MEMLVRVVAIVQARMGSTRFPGKVMELIEGVSMIEIILRRLAQAKRLNHIVVATSLESDDDILYEHIRSLGFDCERGSNHDVLGRYVGAARRCHADVVVRITGDCPLTDPELVDQCIDDFFSSDVDYLSNVLPPTYPDGLDIEVVKFRALEISERETRNSYDREHVTPYIIKSGSFLKSSNRHEEDLSHSRWTVDNPDDLAVIRRIISSFGGDIYVSWRKVLEFERMNPGVFESGRDLRRNLGATLGTGQKLWLRAKRVIPGGNMLLSKRAEMFLPDRWPSYFSRAKGCSVWDLDGNEYVDMSIMGIGTNILGYGHPEVDQAVLQTVHLGNMSTLNCPEEVYLSERLVELHPWADMVRLARTGGEANAVAIRIARAASGRDKVAVCGYHGWHDWYLSVNLSDRTGLDGHLLPGLDPKGVPKALKGTVFPFNYNDFSALLALVDAHDIGVIKMEVSRNMGPEDGFLSKVRELATARGIVLVFDECTSGFRETFGGLHKKYGVEPDIAMFGKALGNGYAITAIVGRREVMDVAQTTFISSTFWTERIGPTAALKSLEVMERERSWELITEIGQNIQTRWTSLASNHGISISLSGLPALSGFTINSPQALAYKTLITQDMMEAGYLAGTSVYVCIDHKPDILDGYFDALSRVFAKIAECEGGRDVDTLLKGPLCHAGFKRLN